MEDAVRRGRERVILEEAMKMEWGWGEAYSWVQARRALVLGTHFRVTLT